VKRSSRPRATTIARSADCSLNAGSLEKHLLDKYGEPCPDAMVGKRHGSYQDPAKTNDFNEFKISCKASDVSWPPAPFSTGRGHGRAHSTRHSTEAGG